MSNINISGEERAKQIVQSLEHDKQFIIKLREASDTFLNKNMETYYDFFYKGIRGSLLNCVIFYFPEPREADVGLFIETDLLRIRIRADFDVVLQEDQSFKSIRYFDPEKANEFSNAQMSEIQELFLQSIYKTAERVL